jgi:hypothetical protein
MWRACVVWAALWLVCCAELPERRAVEAEFESGEAALVLASPELTLWIEPTLEADDRAAGVPFVLAGRSSARIEEIRGRAGGERRRWGVRGAAFGLALDDEMLEAALRGPLVLELEVAGAGRHVVEVEVAARFLRVEGDAAVEVSPWVEARGGGFEGEARAEAAELLVRTDDDSDPETWRAGGLWRFVWGFEALKLAAWPSTDPVHFFVVEGAGEVAGSVRGSLGLVVRGARLEGG